jgi:hypothetical protein
MAAKIQKSYNWDEIWFPNRLWCWELMSIACLLWWPSKMAAKIQKSSNLEEIWFPSRLWCCKLISIVVSLWRPFWIQNGHQNTKFLQFGRNLVSK